MAKRLNKAEKRLAARREGHEKMLKTGGKWVNSGGYKLPGSLKTRPN